MQNQYDVIVVGGGPAGATASGLLSKRGRRVLLLEKEKFPRYHIGESLIPGIMPVIRELGAEQALADLGAIVKHGVTLIWGANKSPWTIRFDEIEASVKTGESAPNPYAYEVKRAEFDNMLLTHSRRLGTTVIEEANVREAIFDGDRCVGVRYNRVPSSEVVEVRAPLVLDASGQTKLLGRRFDNVNWHPDMKNLAVWTYFQGGSRLEGKDAGNIVVEACAPGWLWMIPFSDNTCSVGFVAPGTQFAASDLPPAELLYKNIGEAGEIGRLLAGAVEVSQVRTAKDWSYVCEQVSGPGYLQVGDAAGFIDPLFSTGVMLAMRGGSLAAIAAERVLDAPESEVETLDHYEKEYHSILDIVVTFVRFFYDQNKPVEEYFEKARDLIDPEAERKAREDFIVLISGLDSAIGSRQMA
ncbi:NAD(P)/FAD-dependent oxidoreductase [Nocardia sp. NPDC004604]|uniref:NAD(P)/FAD-dependent oxidoreductase n=1 Tax=Nocardia sp. NPDC004604 TaxID=3157013 RepID=UPI0033A1A7D3